MDDATPHGATLAERFEEARPHLRAVAVRMLGPGGDADDAVQEAWMRLSRSDTAEVDNLRGWLTTVVGRVCLDMLRSRRTRREEPLDLVDAAQAPGLRPVPDVGVGPSVGPDGPGDADPEQQAILADSVGAALLVVLDTLSPAERLAFVLHDLFGVPFEEIAPVVDRTPAAARQLASRARRRVQGADPATSAPDDARRREIVEAFLAASRGGNLRALLELLDPDAVLRADATAVGFGAQPEVSGARAVAETFAGRARTARAALVDGVVQAVWMVADRPRVVFAFTVADGRVRAIDLLADPAVLHGLAVVVDD